MKSGMGRLVWLAHAAACGRGLQPASGAFTVATHTLAHGPAHVPAPNNSDARCRPGALTLAPTIVLTAIAASTITTLLAGMSVEDEALGLPPNKSSSFQVDCDLQPEWTKLYSLGNVPTPTPNFKIYYALAHYHTLGTG